MSGSQVRDIESLAALRAGLIRFAEKTGGILEALRSVIRRIEREFVEAQPGRWRAELRAAERDLGEARERLAARRASARAGDRPAATEASLHVARAERRLRYCQQQEKRARSVAIEVTRCCDRVLGPIAEVDQRCEVDLAQAAAELRRLLDSLRRYADGQPSGPATASAEPHPADPSPPVPRHTDPGANPNE